MPHLETTAEQPKLNVRLLIFASLTILVLIAGVVRGLHLKADDDAAQATTADATESAGG